jgi:hypothetical protein
VNENECDYKTERSQVKWVMNRMRLKNTFSSLVSFPFLWKIHLDSLSVSFLAPSEAVEKNCFCLKLRAVFVHGDHGRGYLSMSVQRNTEFYCKTLLRSKTNASHLLTAWKVTKYPMKAPVHPLHLFFISCEKCRERESPVTS